MMDTLNGIAGSILITMIAVESMNRVLDIFRAMLR